MKLRKEWIAVIVAVILVAAGVMLIDSIASRQDMQEKQLVEEALRKAVLTCYAIEGQYPPSIDYLRVNYGLSYNEDKYVVEYDNHGMANYFPEYTVYELGGAGR
ncbi:MAG: hypothetical protein CW338_01240 [Clostridiales bacterium]|nr:hypothetical protein [Clostridiales bacterium]